MNKTQLKKWIKNNISTRPTIFGTYYGVDLQPLGVGQAIHVSIDKNEAIAELTDEKKSNFKMILNILLDQLFSQIQDTESVLMETLFNGVHQ